MLPQCFFLCLVAALLERVSGVFNPLEPGTEENFYPDEADPQGRITCEGPPPTFHIPVFFGLESDPSTWTLQEICAKPQYGGRGRFQHAGGYCWHYSDEYMDPELVFDFSNDAKGSPVLQHPRVLAYCLLRCFCSNGIDRHNAYEQISTREVAEHMTRPITLDSSTIAGVEIGESEEEVEVYGITSYRQLSAQQYRASHNMQPVVPNTAVTSGICLNPENKIECEGTVPPLALTLYDPRGPSHGIVHWDWQPRMDIHKLCANALSGGADNVNAGAYCHRMSDGTSKVWFSDDITPNQALTWSNFAQSLTVRAYCFSMCSCRGTPRDPNADLRDRVDIPGVFQFVLNRAVGIRPQGNIDVYVTGPNGQVTTVPLMQPAPGGSQVASGACKDDKKRFCPQTWDAEVLGDTKPVEPPPKAPAEDLVQLKQCGATCDDHNDCGSWDSGCRCVTSKTLPKYIPLDPLFPKQPTLPQGKCLSLPEYVLKAAAAGQSILGKREASEGDNSDV